MDKETMTVKEVARRLGISKNKAYQLVQKSDFPAFLLVGRYVVMRDRFDQWIERQLSAK